MKSAFYHPWIKVENLRVGSQNEVFDRQDTESSTETRNADIFLANSVGRLADMSAKGDLIEFVPEQIDEFPVPPDASQEMRAQILRKWSHALADAKAIGNNI